MPSKRVLFHKKRKRTVSPLMVRLDEESKRALVRAAALRHVSVSDYVRTVTVPLAKKEVAASREEVISLTPQEQLEFWNALNETPRLTESQRELGKLMRAAR